MLISVHFQSEMDEGCGQGQTAFTSARIHETLNLIELTYRNPVDGKRVLYISNYQFSIGKIHVCRALYAWFAI